MKNELPPACCNHNCWMINCESNLPGLIHACMVEIASGKGLSRSNLPPEVKCLPGTTYFEVSCPPLKLFAPPSPPSRTCTRDNESTSTMQCSTITNYCWSAIGPNYYYPSCVRCSTGVRNVLFTNFLPGEGAETLVGMAVPYQKMQPSLMSTMRVQLGWTCACHSKKIKIILLSACLIWAYKFMRNK